MDWTLATIVLSTMFVSLGALLQAVTGLGAGLIVVPLLAILSVELIPGPMIFGSLALSASMAFFGRKSIDFTNMPKIIFCLLVGTLLAAVLISVVAFDKLGLLFGIFILGAVGLSLKMPKFSMNVKGMMVASVLSGFMGTAAGIGAPVLAMAYQNHNGASLRATLAFLYFVASVTMLVVLHFAGRFGENEIISGFYLMPGFIAGYFVSPKLVKFIDKGYARPSVLVLSTISAGLLIWRSLQPLLVQL